MALLLRSVPLSAIIAQIFLTLVFSQEAKGNVPYTLPSKRVFLLNVPESYSHEEPHPLVLSFHGAGGSSEKQQHLTQLSDPSLRIADKPFLVAYPLGANNTDWNKTHIWTGAPYENTTVDDIGFVHDIISTVSSDYTVDSSRIYACGKSNGGGFTALLACRPDTSSIFAAFAPVSPALYEGTRAFSGCSPSDPVPILHSHGLEDTVAPFHGRTSGGSGPERDVESWRRMWADINGCDGEPPMVEEVHPGTKEEIWDCPGAEVRALSVDGLGHAWPTTEGLDSSGKPNNTANFNFTSQHLVEFFSSHYLRRNRV